MLIPIESITCEYVFKDYINYTSSPTSDINSNSDSSSRVRRREGTSMPIAWHSCIAMIDMLSTPVCISVKKSMRILSCNTFIIDS